MQAVSAQFISDAQAAYRRPKYGCLVSWKKTVDPLAKFFQLDHSHLDSNDKLKGPEESVAYFDRYDYVNESANVKSFRITKKVSNRPWGVIMATATVELDNTSKRYLPGSDPDIGAYIKRDRPIKLSVGFGSEFINLFVGYTERPDNTIVERVTTLECYDAMTYLSRVKSSLSLMVDTYSHDIIKALLLEQGFTVDQFNIEQSVQQRIGVFDPYDRYVGDMLEEFAESEGMLIFVDEQGIIQVWNRLHMVMNQTNVFALTYSNMKDVQWDTTPVINDVRATSAPLRVSPFDMLFDLNTSNDDMKIPPGETKDIFISFPEELYAISVNTPVHSVDYSGDSLYTTNTQEDGGGSPSPGDISLDSVYNFGKKYSMTFTNSGSQAIWISRVQLFGIPARAQPVTGVAQISQDSIDEYGLNPDNGYKEIVIENDLIQTLNAANAVGYYLMSLFSDPLARMKAKNFALPHLQIGDAGTVLIADTATTYNMRVLGSDLRFTAPAKLTQDLYLEERPIVNYFILDHSQLDGTDRLAL